MTSKVPTRVPETRQPSVPLVMTGNGQQQVHHVAAVDR
jgi:hypothetical protein